jgi:phosphoribosylglycinamide formyltransferase-1
LSAIHDAIEAGSCPAQIARVISDRANAEGLAWARSRGFDTSVVRPSDHADRASWDAALASEVGSVAPDLVVLAGFMRLLGSAMLQRFSRRILNVHPALLPLFPGIDAVPQALAAGVRVSGCSVHLVDAGVDTGPVIAQAVVPVLQDDDADALHTRIQRAEHRLLPRVIGAIADGSIELSPELRVHRAIDPTTTLFSLGSS